MTNYRVYYWVVINKDKEEDDDDDELYHHVPRVHFPYAAIVRTMNFCDFHWKPAWYLHVDGACPHDMFGYPLVNRQKAMENGPWK